MRIFFCLTFFGAAWTLVMPARAQPVSGIRPEAVPESQVPVSWGRMVPGLRLAGGFQRSWYLEAGPSMQIMSFAETHGYFYGDIYLSGSWIPAAYGEKGILGIGYGGECGSNGGALAFDLRYYTDGTRRDLMLTPKLLFGIAYIDLGYGYTISFNKRPFPQIGRHQVLLRVNTNVLVHDRQLKARKRRSGNVVD